MSDTLAVITDALADIAPDVTLAELDPAGDLLQQGDLDSMDFLNLLTALEERLGVTVPERDYPLVRTLDGLVRYLDAARAG
ncbi:MAG: acyl carrier protein [Acidimicrobiales bacterium]